MTRLALAAVLLVAASGAASAQCGTAAAGRPVLGLLTRLNQPFLPNLPATPGLPAVSPLGLLAPRLSFATTFLNNGGFGNLAGNLPNVVGLVTPRLAPIIGLAQNWPPTPQTAFNTGLGIVSPRLATGVQFVQGYQQTGQAIRGAAGGSGGLFGRRCR